MKHLKAVGLASVVFVCLGILLVAYSSVLAPKRLYSMIERLDKDEISTARMAPTVSYVMLMNLSTRETGDEASEQIMSQHVLSVEASWV